MISKGNICQNLFLLLVLMSALKLPAQVNLSLFGSIQVVTDRAMYVAGEEISFAAQVSSPVQPGPGKVFYCELVTPSGERVTGGKYPLHERIGHGCLPIPEETPTGIYYLKSYTRTMRNGSPADYRYILLKIIHPEKAEILTPAANHSAAEDGLKEKELAADSMAVKLELSNEIFSPRDNVQIHLSMTERGPNDTYCLSVVPEPAFREFEVHPTSSVPPGDEIFYYPEGRGISLSGNVTDRNTAERLAGVRVNLSLMGIGDVSAVMTGPDGRFFFALPDLTGRRDLFLSAAAPGDQAIELNIDNDFCTRPVQLPFPGFSLDSLESVSAYNMVLNYKIKKAFYPDTSGAREGGRYSGKPFYGAPSQVLRIDKYIELPTLEEYFNELPLAVKVRKSKGKKHFRFHSTEAEMNIYDPLVLIDWVAVEDMEKILAVNPRDIDRIELVNAPYVKGSVTYGGIISFISSNDDFAGIDLPESGTFIHYQFLEDCRSIIWPLALADNIPDARNTLYWDPMLEPGEDGSMTIELTAPDTPGKYAVILRELNTGWELKKGFTIGP